MTCPRCNVNYNEPPKIYIICGMTRYHMQCGCILKDDPSPKTALVIEDYNRFNNDSKPISYTEIAENYLADKKFARLKKIKAIKSMDGKSLMPYQVDGVNFIQNSSLNNGIAERGYRALISDEMGLGKTVQALGFLNINPEQMPALFIVKSALKVQWQHELFRWCGEEYLAQIIDDAKTFLIPGLKAYIISFDLLRRLDGGKHKSKAKYEDDGEVAKTPVKIDAPHWLTQKLGIKTIVIDECQAIKNTESQRTYEVRAMCFGVENIIALSGTPIKNNASEYFPILNILRPDVFPSYSRFLYNECDSYYNGYSNKTAGLKYPEQFKRKTKDFIIRRERKDVLPDLPAITRNFAYSDLAAEVSKQYEKLQKQFEEEFDKTRMNGFAAEGSIIGFLSQMRHLTGLSKIGPCIEFLEEFTLMTERKIVVFTHHKDVAEILGVRLKKMSFAHLQLHSGLDTTARQLVIESFKDPLGPRILIASTLAAGEGLNLQFCSDCIVMERQWNPANEEQAEGRFIRIGQLSNKITATYMVAVGTIDEFLAELVERKRQVVTETLGMKEATKWDQSSIMKELAEIIRNKGGKKWGW